MQIMHTPAQHFSIWKYVGFVLTACHTATNWPHLLSKTSIYPNIKGAATSVEVYMKLKIEQQI